MSLNIPRMMENELAVIQKNNLGISSREIMKRQAKIYYLNADRYVHARKRLSALRLLARGIYYCPYLYVDIAVVCIKLLLGGHSIIRLRKWLNANDSFLARWYWKIYSRY